MQKRIRYSRYLEGLSWDLVGYKRKKEVYLKVQPLLILSYREWELTQSDG
jgi:hypothetical protein